MDQCVEAWIKFMIRKGIQNETVKEKQFENKKQGKKITSEKKNKNKAGRVNLVFHAMITEIRSMLGAAFTKKVEIAVRIGMTSA